MLAKSLLVLFLAAGWAAGCRSSASLHRKALVVDTHNDVLIAILKGHSIEQNLAGITHSDLDRFARGGVDVQVFSVWSDEAWGKGRGFAYANRQIDSIYALAARNPQRVMLVRTPQELERAVRQKKLGAMLGLEGGHMIEDSLFYLDSLYKRGVRYMTLTWNNSTGWATSAADESAGRVQGGKGLNAFGRAVVQRMNRLGMLVDLSHAGEQTFWDVLQTTTKPVLVSHSCVYALCPVPRNLKDDQIKAIGKNGGVIHLNFYSGFLDSSFQPRQRAFNERHKREIDSLRARQWESHEIGDWLSRQYPAEANALRPPLSLLLDHLDYIARLIGVEHVGLGSDFDGISSTPQGLDDVTAFPLVTAGLRERGYSNKDIRKILGENFVRLFRQNTKP